MDDRTLGLVKALPPDHFQRLYTLVTQVLAAKERDLVQPQPQATTSTGMRPAPLEARVPMPSWAATARPPDPETNAVVRLDFAARGGDLDLVVYGDSIMHGLRVMSGMEGTPGQASVRRHFARFAGRYVIAGGPASTTANLVWRIARGGEAPRRPPKAVLLHIGTNDVTRGFSATRFEYLVGMFDPEVTKVFVLALLPTTLYDVAPANMAIADVLRRKFPGATLLTCGSRFDPTNKAQFADGLHPTGPAYDAILACAMPKIAKAVKQK